MNHGRARPAILEAESQRGEAFPGFLDAGVVIGAVQPAEGVDHLPEQQCDDGDEQ